MAKQQGIRAGRAYVELGTSNKIGAGLKSAQKQLRAFGKALRGYGTQAIAAGAAITAPLLASAKIFAGMGDQLNKMSARTGISAEALSQLGFAAEQSGANLETLEKGVRTMQRTIGDAADGLGTAEDALGHLGLTLQDVQGLSPEEQFTLIADRLSRIPDETMRAVAAMDIFGRAGTQLLPMLANGAKGIEELRDQADALGLTVSTEAAADAAVLTDTWNILVRTFKQAVFTIGSALAPTIIDVSKRITAVVVSARAWIDQNKELVTTILLVGVGVAAAGASLIAFGLLFSGLASGIGAFLAIASGVGTALSAIGTVAAAILSPIGLVVAAIAGLGAAALVYSGAAGEALEWLRDQFGRLGDFAKSVFGGIRDALSAGDIGLAAEILWKSLEVAWRTGVAELNTIWIGAKNDFLDVFSKLWHGALAFSQEIFHALEVAWIETTAFLSKTWVNFTSGFESAWESTTDWVTNRLLELRGLADDTFDVDAAKQLAAQESDAIQQQIGIDRDQAIASREGERQAARESAQAINDATLAVIGEQYGRASDQLDQQARTSLAMSATELEAARSELAEAIADAAAQNASLDAGGPAPRLKMTLEDLEDRLSNLGDAAQKTSVAGTFNALAIRGLSVSNPAERTARTAEKIEKLTARIERAIELGIKIAVQ